jgi:Endonuclease/Exonuclease/phosphatase family
MILRVACFLTCLSLISNSICAQTSAAGQTYRVAIAGFYNLENLFDTIDTDGVSDEEFSPAGPKNYNGKLYNDKLGKLATVISQQGTDMSPDGPAILGVSEIENRSVLVDLAAHPLLRKRNYQIVHYDSKDARGVDVAMFYNPKYFTVDTSASLYVELPGGSKDARYTRDILYVKGRLAGETIHIYVNHWPSRSGGEERSAPARNAAATVCRRHIEQVVFKQDPKAKILVMGDLNDDPFNESIVDIMRAVGKATDIGKSGFFNPWYDLHRKGFGTLAYQDAWGLFDQILISKAWLDKGQPDWFFHRAQIFSRDYMIEHIGKYKGYPMRTWDGNIYRGGYSDHFPTHVVLLKRND